MQGWLVGIQIFVPFFVYNSIFHQSQLVICIIFCIFNYSYFIKKVKSIHDKLSLIEYRIHKKNDTDDLYIAYSNKVQKQEQIMNSKSESS